MDALKAQVRKLMEDNRLDEAMALCTRLCSQEPNDVDAWQALSTIHGRMGHFEAVEKISRIAISIRPDYAEAHNNLGKALLMKGHQDEAFASFQQAIKFDSNLTDGYFNAANILKDGDKDEEALYYYHQAIKTDPENAGAYHNLGVLYIKLDRTDDALLSFNEALRLSHNPKTLFNIATCLRQLGRFEESIDYYEKVIALDPDKDSAIACIASVLNKLGKYNDSYECLKPYIDKGTDSPEIAVSFAEICNHVNRCDDAIELAERILNQQAQTQVHGIRKELYFALGNLYDTAGQYKQAFKHYQQGNELVAGVKFDPLQHRNTIDRLIDTFSEEFIKNCPVSTIRSDRPIFIVGMPRSGTTLVEQILSCHPDIYGGGELGAINNITNLLPSVLSTSELYPECVKALTVEECDHLGDEYLNVLRGLSKDAAKVIDKMPSNFLHLGLINMLFPDARIIHCVRDPFDTCLSCYFQNFEYKIAYSYSYNLEHLGIYHKEYQRLMKHWLAVLPLKIMEVHYEQLVSNQKNVSRDMIKFCGVEWDERCLRFYESKRVANTLSINQVRERMYNSSVARWKHYDRYLAPLKAALFG